MKKFKVSVTGCGLGDFLYNNIDFSSEAFAEYQSLQSGDGGLEPGKLVFTHELETFALKPFSQILGEITGLRKYETFNIGGPALVCAINAAQLLHNIDAEVLYYGGRANDDKGNAIASLLEQLPLNLEHYLVLEGETPYTDVLSDPHFANGKGERTFVNNIACAAQFSTNCLEENFWESNIIVFGGTALVPKLHADLTNLLAKAKLNGSFTIVNTVYDFLSQKQDPNKPWSLGNTQESLPMIDLLIMDHEEALRISGQHNMIDAIIAFKDNCCNAFIITQGADSTYLYSSGKLFKPIETTLPVCHWIANDFAENPNLKGDTTGCGDNFVGAVVASIVQQLINKNEALSLKEAAIMGTVCGGFACYYVGGTYFEKYAGEKLEKINDMMKQYVK